MKNIRMTVIGDDFKMIKSVTLNNTHIIEDIQERSSASSLCNKFIELDIIVANHKILR